MGSGAESHPPPPPDSSSPSLPFLESSRRSALLRRVAEAGGFAFAASAEQAFTAGDLRAAEAAREMAWEQLHSGPWHDVGSAWRDAYAMACLHVAALRLAAGERKEALRALDMGIIMGGTLLRRELCDAVKTIVTVRCRGDGDESDGRDCSGGDKNWVTDEISNSKSWDLNEVIRILPTKSLSCKLVEKQPSLSFDAFVCDYFLRASPVIISGSIDHWPARTRWKDLEYLKRVADDRTIPVEVGTNYLSPEWKQELITFGQFLERIQSSECPTKLSYLAQHTLFDQIEELRNDIMVPDYCFAGGGELHSLNAWFGPPGTVTPLHHDPHHNLFAQVVGRKYIRLYPASVSEDLYPYSESMLSNSSQVDLDSLDIAEFPKADHLEFLDCVLDEGELLYIPPKWWHYVRSLSTSFSVSFWWTASGIDTNTI